MNSEPGRHIIESPKDETDMNLIIERKSDDYPYEE